LRRKKGDNAGDSVRLKVGQKTTYTKKQTKPKNFWFKG